MTAPTSLQLLDSFRRDRSRGTNDDIDLTLRPAYQELLAKLGNPHEHLPPIFHVAGTNGKGSTCAFLRAILEAAGYRVHVYTSPHLVSFHERIRVAGKLIGEDELVALLQECRSHAVADHVTYFEAATAVAFAAFARTPADFAIVEVGLGGRLDATNIIPKPLASLIARLSFDHREYLGDTMVKIACEKAGIMKKNVPCFAMAQPDTEAAATLRVRAHDIGASLYMGGVAWQIEKLVTGFRYTDRQHTLELPDPALLGEHQYANAGLAIAALLAVTDPKRVTVDTIRHGLQHVNWPARLQHLTAGKLVEILPIGTELWLDGGHNDSAGEVLAQQAARWQKQDQKPLHLIGGMLTTKNPAEFLQPLKPYIASLQTVPIDNEPASFTAENLAKVVREMGIKNVTSVSDVPTALRHHTAQHTSPARILMVGSLYLAGQILKLNDA
jgi:dihydrofolate synthase/folylpolyglutamate synthase